MPIQTSKKSPKKEKKPEISTKEKILDVSIDLFSQRGFNGVSIREIAREVGIRESSIYNHYRSKDAIMDSVFEYFKEELTKMRPPDARNVDKLGQITPEIFLHRANHTLNILKNPKMEKIFIIISNEQFRDERAKKIVLEYLLHEPYTFSKKVLEKMVNVGTINKLDPKIMAVEFQYPIYSLFLENLLLRSDGSDTRANEKMIANHLGYFVNSLKKEQ
ncbi:MAG: TetR/AcrR family transcriptional regulator [Methanobacteriaceae archaeon]